MVALYGEVHMYAREMARMGGRMWISRRPRRGSVPRAMPMEKPNYVAFWLELLCTTCRCCVIREVVGQVLGIESLIVDIPPTF
jgi:hypothetical protein